MRRLFLSTAIAGGLAICASAGAARADVLHITGTADNQFSVYLATAAEFSANTLGTQIGSNPAGNNWQIAYTLPDTALPNSSPLYLQIVLTNWTPTNGFPQYPYSPTSNPSAFIADLSITGGNYAFPNASGTISTDSTNWLGSTTTAASTWTATTTGVVAYGTNDGSANIWTNANGGPLGGISSGAQWIFYGDQSTALYSDLSLKILSTNSSITPTPLPAAVWMMGSVLAGGAGFGSWRKRRKAA